MLRSRKNKTELTDLIEFLQGAIVAGIDLIQIRERDLSARDLFYLAEAVAQSARDTSINILINDRADVARCAGAGVHLTTRSLEAEIVRRKFGHDMLIGVSTHSLEEAQAAERGGANFIVFGPVFETESKRAYGPPVGLDALGEVAGRLSIPVLALGGIKMLNFRQALDKGAAGIAGISLFAEAADLAAVVREIKQPSVLTKD